MKYRLKKETKPTLPTFGKYKAVAVHYHTVESRQLIKEVAQRMGTHTSNVLAVMTSVAEVRGVRLHFLPQSYEGHQELYEGITFEKDKLYTEE